MDAFHAKAEEDTTEVPKKVGSGARRRETCWVLMFTCSLVSYFLLDWCDAKLGFSRKSHCMKLEQLENSALNYNLLVRVSS